MEVYWEIVFCENAVVDFVLLLVSRLAVKGKIVWKRMIFSSLAGGAFAVCFPLLRIPQWFSACLKILFGVFLALACGKGKSSFAPILSFWIVSFVYAGFLYALSGILSSPLAVGKGYLIEKIPLSLASACLILFLFFGIKLTKKWYSFRQMKKKTARGVLRQGERMVEREILFDSGNLLSFRGRGVCLVSAKGLLALYGKDFSRFAVGTIAIRTACGEKESPVFLLDELSVEDGETRIFTEIYLTVGDVGNRCVVGSEIREGNYGVIRYAEKLSAKEEGRGEYSPLFMRK